MSLHDLIRATPQLQGFVFDPKERVIRIFSALPWSGELPRPWRDRDSNELKRWLASNHPEIRATIKDIDRAVREVAYHRAPAPSAFRRAMANLEGADDRGSVPPIKIDGGWRVDRSAP